MQGYIIKRILLNIPVLFIVSILVFSLMRLLPGNAVIAQIGSTGDIPAYDLAKLEKQLGLLKPAGEAYPVWFAQQYLDWAKGAVHGDFGVSLWTQGSALKRMTDALPISFELGAIAIVISILLAVPLGALSAVRQNTGFDYFGRIFSIAWLSLPDFWVGTLFVTFAALWFKWQAPIGFVPLIKDPRTNMEQILPPAIILGLIRSAPTMRLMRSSMLEVMRQDYVRTARAKGLKGLVVISRHALKNSILPVVTIIGTQIGFLIGGQVILETLFNLPGVGQLAFASIGQRDYTEIQTITMFLAVVLILTNLVTDISYGWFDPRIRYG